jgi:hypothetical protein
MAALPPPMLRGSAGPRTWTRSAQAITVTMAALRGGVCWLPPHVPFWTHARTCGSSP